MKGFSSLEQNIIKKGLCCKCGTCIGACPHDLLRFDSDTESIEITDPLKCTHCGLCSKVCPGKDFDWDATLKEGTYKQQVGYYQNIYTGYSQDSQIKEHAASGGVATAIALYLLEHQLVDGVVGIVSEKLDAKVKILRTRDEVLSALQSKYRFVPTNEILRQMQVEKGTYLYVGLPCQVQGLRRAMDTMPKLKASIYMTVGIFCGFNMSKEATEFLIKKSKIARDDIETVEYRAKQGGVTGFKITGHNQDFFISKHGYTILNAFYAIPRCFKCYDLTAEFADISLGDAWEIVPASTRIISRTKETEHLLQQMHEEGYIVLAESDYQHMEETQKKVIGYKKRDIFTRIKLFHNLPDHLQDQKAEKINPKALLFSLFLIVGQWKITRYMLSLVPITLLEKLSTSMRNGKAGKESKEVVSYAFWGVITILFSFTSYSILLLCNMDHNLANLISILSTKVFAYVTNKKFVFHSKCENIRQVLVEMGTFLLARSFSGVIELIGVFVFVDVFKVSEYISKILTIGITTVVNYFASKKFVFNRKE
ncbi:MAG: Coenzyme F420 hydrogenase/dehydrogenase, beta subunit C-terminal domain [Lachnospiraceae bacterium]